MHDDGTFVQCPREICNCNQSCLTFAILECSFASTKKNEAVLLQSNSFFQKNQISSQLPDQISYLGMPSTFPIPKRKNFDPTPLLKWLQNRDLFLGCSTPRIYNQFLECGREWAFQQHSPRLAIPKTTTPSHRMGDMECSFLSSPSQNGALTVSGQSQSGMLNNSAGYNKVQRFIGICERGRSGVFGVSRLQICHFIMLKKCIWLVLRRVCKKRKS